MDDFGTIDVALDGKMLQNQEQVEIYNDLLQRLPMEAKNSRYISGFISHHTGEASLMFMWLNKGDLVSIEYYFYRGDYVLEKWSSSNRNVVTVPNKIEAIQVLDEYLQELYGD